MNTFPGMRTGIVSLPIALIAMLGFGAASANAEVTADLRVLTPTVTLDDGKSYVTDTTRVRTDPEATCFGAGGTGDRVRVAGPTPLGTLRDAARVSSALRPLSISDGSGFGLAVCGIGGIVSSGSEFWYVLVNNAGLDVGGDQFESEEGDQVTWYLTSSFPPPNELELVAPPGAIPGVAFQVTVFEHVCMNSGPPDYVTTCAPQPAQGATVSGANGGSPTTDPSGHAMVNHSAAGEIELRATLGSEIPSNLVDVCLAADPGNCPDAHGKTIFGRDVADRIRGTAGWDRIRARGGPDVIQIRAGGRDTVSCGGGSDIVVRNRGDRDDTIRKSCERVIKK